MDSEFSNQEVVIKKPAMPPTNFVWAILSTLFCCLPLGIISIVYASKVESLYHQARYDEARDASHKAKMYAICAAISLGVFLVVAFLGELFDEMF